jgi:hypothetical protein
MPEVPRRTTPVSLASLWKAVEADGSARGWGPTETVLHAALAAVETRQGQSIQNHSPGNVSAAGFYNGKEKILWGGDYWRPPWFADESNALHAKMLAGQAPSAFRAYATLAGGLRDWSALLMNPDYSSLRQAAQSGDVDRYVQALHESGYSKDYSVAKHGGTFRSIVKSLQAVGAPALDTSGAGGSSMWPLVVGLGVVGLGGGYLLWRAFR